VLIERVNARVVSELCLNIPPLRVIVVHPHPGCSRGETGVGICGPLNEETSRRTEYEGVHVR
jgi:hypothetical protein